MDITTCTIFEADRQYALYKKGQRDLPERKTFLGKPFPQDHELLSLVMAAVPKTKNKKKQTQ